MELQDYRKIGYEAVEVGKSARTGVMALKSGRLFNGVGRGKAAVAAKGAISY